MTVDSEMGNFLAIHPNFFLRNKNNKYNKMKNILSHPVDRELAKKGWTQKEYDWLMQTLDNLSGKELYELYKIVDLKGWKYQEKSGLTKKLSESINIVNLITFLICSFESFEKEEVKKIVRDFVKKHPNKP